MAEAPRIVFCGEALIDFLAVGDGVYRAAPGGSPFSAVKAAARAGGRAGFAGAVSTDMFGEQLLADLTAHDVDTSWTPRVDAPTPLAFAQIDADGGARYAFYDRGSTMEEMAPSLPPGALCAGDVLGIGSISLITESGASRIAAFALEQAATATLSLDPNVRPSMLADQSAWRPRMEKLLEAAAIIKLSTEDLEFYAPGTAPADFARERLASGACLVMVTDGAQGAVAWTKSGTAQVPAPQVEVVDTVGAGDVLLGSALAWLAGAGATGKQELAALGDAQLQELLTFAACAAAINCEAAGCVPPPRAAIDARLAAQT